MWNKDGKREIHLHLFFSEEEYLALEKYCIGNNTNMQEIAKEAFKASLIRNESGLCPFCGSKDIEGSTFDVEGEKCFQDVSCLECNERWSEEYLLNNFIEIQQ